MDIEIFETLHQSYSGPDPNLSDKINERFERYAKTLQQFAQLISNPQLLGANNISMACVPSSTTFDKTAPTYSQELPELLSHLSSHARDIVAPLKFCLMYLTSLLQKQSLKHHYDCFQRFLLLRPSLIALSSNSSINMEESKKLIAEWIEFLLDTLSPPRKSTFPDDLLVLMGTVNVILQSLAKCDIYNRFILNGIVNKLKYCLSYYVTNETFKNYIVLHMNTIERLMVTMKETIRTAISRNQIRWEEKQELCEIFSLLRKCFDGGLHLQWINLQIYHIEKFI